MNEELKNNDSTASLCSTPHSSLSSILLIGDKLPETGRLAESTSGVGSTQFQLIQADRLSTGLAQLAKERIALILLDLTLPDSQGLATFQQVFTQAPDVPIVVLVDSVAEPLATQAIQEGAQDYLVKEQFDSLLLARLIHYILERQRMLADLTWYRQELQTSEEAIKQAEQEREQLLLAEREQRLRAETLAEVTLALTRQVSPAAVLNEILRQVQYIVPYSAANFALVEGDTLRVACWQGYQAFGSEKSIAHTVQSLSDVSLGAEAIRSRQPIIVPNTRQEPRWRWLADMAWIWSHLVMPICLRDRVLGLLRLDAATPGQFSPQDAERLQPLANAAAIALENAWLFETAQQHLAELEAIHQASLSLTSSLELQAVLEAILKSTLSLMSGAHDAHVFLYQAGHLEFGAALWADETQSHLPAKPRLHGLTYRVAQQGQPIAIADVQTHPLYTGIHPDWGGAIVGLPLKIGQHVVGVMNVFYQQVHAWQEAELHVLHLLADQAAIAIKNARLYEQAQQELAERRRAEEALRQSEERFRLVVSSISDHIYVTEVTEEGWRTNLYLSPHVETLTGYPLEKFIADWSFWPSTVIHAKDRAVAAAQAGQLALGYDSEVEYRLVRADGTVIWVRDSARVQRENSAAKIIYGVVSNITERKRAELEREWLTNELRDINQTLDERVQARTAELQAILDAAGEGIVVTDMAGVIQYVNPALARLTGYDEVEIMGQTPRLWKSGQQEAGIYTQMWQTILAGQTWRGELVNKHKDGSFYDVLLTIAPIPGPDNQPLGFVGVQSDITPFKEMDRLKSEFITMAAHELRTPLTSILGFSEILLTRPLNDERKTRYLTFINQQAEALRAIIDDLLDLARLEAGEGFDITETLVDLKEIAREVLFGFQENNPDHHYNITGIETWPQIKGDPVKLAQLFKNLFSNATKYSPPDSEITLSATLEAEYGMLHLSLTDQGIGMTPEQLAQIFDRFYRGDASSTAASGTGLGMTISRLIVERHQGKIWVESEYKYGTTIHILLPLLNRPTFILIIEDEQGLRELQKRVLKAEGFTVLEAPEGQTGLKLAQTYFPHLILLDLALPGITGFAVLDQLQANYLTKDIPVIITSAMDTAAEIEQAIKKGAIDYLVKPYGMADLTVRVNRALAKNSG